ncbi:hypothetical protein OsI_19650 [Oryza sativa Indica Group]|uniref:Uncharacterized protein n=1 Tax=Oryza sativa subsp. indica TaxID=39946 RepID=A2Y3R7_ORYSI|nr:hypothetical protein OsI_19650 [Oryza sativa Indica Group]
MVAAVHGRRRPAQWRWWRRGLLAALVAEGDGTTASLAVAAVCGYGGDYSGGGGRVGGLGRRQEGGGSLWQWEDVGSRRRCEGGGGSWQREDEGKRRWQRPDHGTSPLGGRPHRGVTA